MGSKPKTPNMPPPQAAPVQVETTQVTKLVRDMTARRGRKSMLSDAAAPAYSGARRSTLLGGTE